MTKAELHEHDVLSFVRQRDYKFVKYLGRGACGETILLFDDQIGEQFVCKKYAPIPKVDRVALYSAFVREIKLLHKVLHPNVVRVFNYYLYPSSLSGYIIMEYIDGTTIDSHLRQHPEDINSLFVQTIAGFAYLERVGVLHRDIRDLNLMVSNDGTLKIIDFGFGKQVESAKGFDKSISLNWWCELPQEFEAGRYDFRTEVYFVGKLFQKIAIEIGVVDIDFLSTIAKMCKHNPDDRVEGFVAIELAIKNSEFSEIPFSQADLIAYRMFSDALAECLVSIRSGAKYVSPVATVRRRIEDQYRRMMLEEIVPDRAALLRCFIEGGFVYRTRERLPVSVVAAFWNLVRRTDDEKAALILANLYTRLDGVKREPDDDDDIPF